MNTLPVTDMHRLKDVGKLNTTHGKGEFKIG